MIPYDPVGPKLLEKVHSLFWRHPPVELSVVFRFLLE
jgi:hypothetical protein